MDFAPSPRAADLTARVADFMATEITPVEARLPPRPGRGTAYRRPVDSRCRCSRSSRQKARAQGLWNLFLPKEHAGEYAARFGTDGGEGLTNVDYAPLAELMGRSAIAPLVFNCNAPDTGNMEVLLRYGTEEQRARVARAAARRPDPVGVHDDRARRGVLRRDQHGGHRVVDGDEVVVNGRKWWSTGVGHPDCKIFVFMGVTDPEADRHHRHSMVLVPRDAPGVTVERMLADDGDLRRAARPRRGVVHRRAGAGRERHLRARRGLRDRAGPARPGPGAPLHAADRAGRDGARAGLPARPRAHRVRQAAGQPRRQPRARSPTPGSRSTRPGCWC